MLEAEEVREQRIERIEKEIIIMSAALVRLTNAVGQVGIRINEVAQAIKDHPSNEDGELNGLAATLEAAATELQQVADSVNQPGQPETPPSGGDQPPAQPPVENLPSGDPSQPPSGGDTQPPSGS